MIKYKWKRIGLLLLIPELTDSYDLKRPKIERMQSSKDASAGKTKRIISRAGSCCVTSIIALLMWNANTT